MGTAVIIAYLVSGNLRGVSEGDSEIDNMNMEKDENVAEDLNAEKESFIQYYSTLSTEARLLSKIWKRLRHEWAQKKEEKWRIGWTVID